VDTPFFRGKEQNMSENYSGKKIPPKLHYKVGVVRLQMVKEGRSLYGMEPVNGPKKAADMVRPLFAYADREMMVVLSLNTKGYPVAAEVVAVGSLDTCPVSMRELFKHAVLSNAARLLCFHNHPSGDPAPSKIDLEITKRMIAAGMILGIPLDDHIILGDKEFVSLKNGDHGNLWENALGREVGA